MNIKLQSILIIILAVCLLAIGYLFSLWRNEVKESDRWKNNYASERENSARREDLTTKEFKQYFTKYDSILRSLDIKTRNVTDVLHIKYSYKDSVVLKTIRDTVHNTQDFLLSKDCYEIAGSVNNDVIKAKLYFYDDIIPFMYKDWDHRFLFVKWGKFYTAKVYSVCQQDTIKVKKYIHIEKNKRKLRENQ
jgi:hypothetical protein